MLGRRTAASDAPPARRGPSPQARPTDSAYDRAARQALDFADDLRGRAGRVEVGKLLAEARARLDRFASDLGAARLPPASIRPARLALALLLDQAARANRRLPLQEWSAGAHRLLFEGEPMSPARLRDFAARAEAAGPAFAEVARFLAACLDRLEQARTHLDRPAPDGWGWQLAAAVVGFAVLVLAWTLHAEWSFHRDTARAFAAETVAIGLDRRGPVSDLAGRLVRMAAAVAAVDRSVGKAPAHVFAGPLGFDARDGAQAAQTDAIRLHLPPVLANGIDIALASEGDSAALYDTLRAWSILSGAADWNAGFLQGWLADRAAILRDLQGLVPHVARLAPPFDPPPAPDAEILGQARVLAAGAPEADRAWIELIRSPAMHALAPWRPAAEVPGLADIAVTRSGRPVEAPIPGAYTRAGWAQARQGGAADAVAAARREAARLFPEALPTQPDTEDQVLARLQDETLAVWHRFLADLRVRPFDRPRVAERVSGLLARKQSPLALLLAAVWQEVGGTDRDRPHALQLRIATEFGPTIQYVERGGLDEISALFASLNAVLGARANSDEVLTERLMGFQDRAASVAALRQAPPVVVQIVEDVLAQTAAPAAQIANPLTQGWQTAVFELCRRTVEGRFPFDPQGADADQADFAALLGPQGALATFFQTEAEPYIDTTASPWRWRPEARFNGLSPESAAMFERAAAIRADFFDPAGALGTTVTLAALAERGKAVVTLGGNSATVASTSDAAALAWPGAQPAAGVAVVFRSGASEAQVARPGPWGLLRLLSGLRLRERDGGARFLVDLRSDAGRLFMEMSFPAAANPVKGLAAARDFVCPAAL